MVAPLTLRLTDEAQRQIEEAGDWLYSLSPDAATRFSDRLNEELKALCQSYAEKISQGERLPPLDELGSLAYSAPVFRFVFQTGKRRARRSSSGVWYVYFRLVDRNTDGVADTLRVLSVRHAASRPVWSPEDDSETE